MKGCFIHVYANMYKTAFLMWLSIMFSLLFETVLDFIVFPITTKNKARDKP